MYECINCGAGLRFDIDSQKMKCDHCDTTMDINDLKKENPEDQVYTTNIFVCPQCGGEIYTQDNDVTGRCSYCGTTQIFKSRVEKMAAPRWIIPFKKDKSYCKTLYRNAVKRAFFAPKEIKNESYIEEIRGIYMPYWMYECNYDMDLNMLAIDSSQTKVKDNMVTRYKYRINTKLQAEYLAMHEDASSWYWDEISENIRPFHLALSDSNMKEFHPAYLSGFYGETADVERPKSSKATVYEQSAIQKAEHYVIGRMKQDHFAVETGFDKVRKPENSGFQMALLPVWFLSYNKGNRISYSVINGQTGRFSAEFPVDLKKFLLCTCALAATIFMVLNLFWVMRPEYVAMAAAIGSLWAIRYTCLDLREIARKECEMIPLSQRKGTSKPKREVKEFDRRRLIPYAFIALLILAENAGYIDRHPRGIMTFLPILFTLASLIFATKEMMNYWDSTRNYFKRMDCKVFPGHYLAYLSILVALIIEVYHPVSDSIYFGIGFFCMAMTLASLISVVLAYNRMVSRAMPQFEHMGGDGHA